MSSIGNGKIWSKQKILDYINQENIEKDLKPLKRQYWSWCIIKNNIVCGFIGIHINNDNNKNKNKNKNIHPKLSKKKLKQSLQTKSKQSLQSLQNNIINLEIRIFVDTKFQGQCIATNAIELLKKKVKLIFKNTNTNTNTNTRTINLISYVKPSNIASIKIHNKTNFINYGLHHIYGNKFICYKFTII